VKLQTPANDDNGPPTAWIHVCHHHWNPKIAPANSAPSPVQSYRPLTNIPATPPARENVPYDSGGIQNRFGLLGSNIKPDVSGNFESEPSGLVMSTTQLARVQNTDHEPIPFASTGPSLGALEGKNLRLAPPTFLSIITCGCCVSSSSSPSNCSHCHHCITSYSSCFPSIRYFYVGSSHRHQQRFKAQGEGARRNLPSSVQTLF